MPNIERAFQSHTHIEKVRVAKAPIPAINGGNDDIKSKNAMMNTVLGLLLRGDMNCAGAEKDPNGSLFDVQTPTAGTAAGVNDQRPARRPGEIPAGVIRTEAEKQKAEEEARIKREEEEILPGLGAFQLSPSHDSSENIKGFLAGVAKHLCDRVTRWENYTYRAYQIYKQSRAEFLAERDRVEGLTIPDYDEKETRDDRRVNLDAATAERYLDPDRYISVELKESEKALKWAYEHNVFILEKKKWDELGKPGPAKVTLISVAWHPPINLIVQRFVDTMQGWMVQGKYPSCPYAFPTQKDRDREYLVWVVRAIDTKTLETRLQKSVSAH
jgi:hypothetical protein